MQKTFDETKKEGRILANLKGESIAFGSYSFANPPMSKANQFRCIEQVVPIPEKAFALGKLKDGVVTSGGMLGMLFSSRTREELLGSTAKNSKAAFIGGAAAAGVGLVVGLVSTLVG